ncbi:MAG: GAF domain-containing protein, partial [Candidatus Dadabacteria bacterium]|nr:GAF domain-containing protein [Candidatus Dadabacteria bacterium]
TFCSIAILDNDIFVIPDTHRDPNFADNLLVIDEPYIRFYAGYPLKYEGVNLGTLCIIDNVPRTFSHSDLDILRSLGKMVEDELMVTALNSSQTNLKNELNQVKHISMLDPLTKLWNRK